ncbi:acyltransferase family protein [Macrococcoides canis]|uniref:acyltransferase family protein n=1 Tax=Macrococcoides canis TaxID=1855823 RepID=UPI0020B7AA87|nr:acyltransferase family protein [Macrococcus canis]
MVDENMKNLNERFQVERRFRPEIEGLRIVAALLVAVYHIWFNRVSGGVDVFFVISGFLITASIISKIKKDNELSARKYFGSLLKRLLPGALTVIGITSLLSIFLLPSSILLKYIKEAFASLFYYQNLQLAYSSTDYLDKEQMKTPLEHFWAMSIQGQFYIVWFLIFIFVVYILKKAEWVKPEKLITFIFVVLFILSLSFSIYQTAVNQPFAYFNPLARIWQFALGGLMFLHLNKINVPDRISDILGWFGLIGLVLTGMLFDVGSVFPGIASLWPMFCAILILLSGNHPSKYGVERLLSSQPMVFLGGISFGIYLWHWVILSFYKYKINEKVGLIEGIIIILLSITLSMIMTKYIEKPLRNNVIFPKKNFSILYSFNIILIIFLLSSYLLQSYEQSKIEDIANKDLNKISKEYPGALAEKNFKNTKSLQTITTVRNDRSDAYNDGGMATEGSELIIRKYGEVNNPKKNILLTGGSHSSQWLGALQQFAKNEGILITHICRSGTRFTTDVQPKEEMEWMRKLNTYIEKNSDEIDMIFAPANVTDNKNSAMPDGFKEQFKKMGNLNIKVFAVKDNPRLGRNNHPIEQYERNNKWTMDVTKINSGDEWKDETLTNVVYYNYNQYITPNNIFHPIIGNIFVYYDGSHMTDSYVRTLGPIIKDDVLKELDMK